jgi:hypothetical protein
MEETGLNGDALAVNCDMMSRYGSSQSRGQAHSQRMRDSLELVAVIRRNLEVLYYGE